VPLTSDAARLLAVVREVFRQRGDRWFLFGAQAVVAHGFPRTTGDVDVTVVPADGNPRALAAALVSAGLTLRVSDVDDFVERTAVLPFLHEPTGLGLDVVLGASGLENDCIDRAVAVDIGDGTVPVIRVEDLVVLKVLSGRPKDVEDVRSILRRRRRTLDLGQVRTLLGQLEEALGQSDLVPELERLLVEEERPRRARGPTARPRG
jgi:hypothetical protein